MTENKRTGTGFRLLLAGLAAVLTVLPAWTHTARAADAKTADLVYANWEDEGFDISLDGSPLPTEYTPDGFVHSLDFGTLSDCFMESVGPDMVGHED